MEKLPSDKEILEQELIRVLKEKGLENPETKNLLAKWIFDTEKELNQNPESLSRIEMNIRRGRLYFSAGYIEEAYDSLSAAATQADNEGNQELFTSILAEMDEMDNELG